MSRYIADINLSNSYIMAKMEASSDGIRTSGLENVAQS